MADNELVKLARAADFDKSLAYKSYCNWLESKSADDLEKVIIHSLPVLGRTTRLFFENPFLDEDELFSAAYISFLSVILGKKFKGSDEDTFDAFLSSVSYNAMINYAKNFYSTDCFDYWFKCANLPYGKLITINDVDYKLFIEQLPSIIYQEVYPKIRFKDNYLGACSYILKRMLYGNRVVARFMINKYKVSVKDAKFLTDYISVLVRNCLYNMRDQLENKFVIDDWYDIVAVFDPSNYEEHV